jgi:hypothetical protein
LIDDWKPAAGLASASESAKTRSTDPTL